MICNSFLYIWETSSWDMYYLHFSYLFDCWNVSIICCYVLKNVLEETMDDMFIVLELHNPL